jgi:hypothetical protein
MVVVSPRELLSLTKKTVNFCESHYLLMYKIPSVLNVEYLFFDVDVELLCFWVGPINLEPNTSRRIWYTMWCCDALL